MHLEKFFNQNVIQNIFYLRVRIKKLNFARHIFDIFRHSKILSRLKKCFLTGETWPLKG